MAAVKLGQPELQSCAEMCRAVWVQKGCLLWTLCCKAGVHPAAYSLTLCPSLVSSGAAFCKHFRGPHAVLAFSSTLAGHLLAAAAASRR